MMQPPGPGGPPQAGPPAGGPPPGGPEAAPQGGEGPEKVMAVFNNIGKAMEQVGGALEGAPPEIKAKFDAALAAYQDFLQTFTGGAPQGAPGPEAGPPPPGPQAPEQAGNPDVQPVR